MAKLIALYKHPQDTTAFNEYYFRRHIPLAKTMELLVFDSKEV